jgi:UDP-N-acetylglucosamine:LPS N-acetylglucosamine transferase
LTDFQTIILKYPAALQRGFFNHFINKQICLEIKLQKILSEYGIDYMKQEIFFLLYGEGGHKAQMERLLDRLMNSDDDRFFKFIGISEGIYTPILKIKNYFLFPIRKKYSFFISLLVFPFIFFFNLVKILWLVIKYKPKGLISTGPGLVLLPALLFKIIMKKVIYIETWSRFNTKSMTGKYMYKIADRFYIQNIELLKFYPTAIYAGLL